MYCPPSDGISIESSRSEESTSSTTSTTTTTTTTTTEAEEEEEEENLPVRKKRSENELDPGCVWSKTEIVKLNRKAI